MTAAGMPRRCKECGIEKPASEFPKTQARCCICHKAHMREWRQQNAERVRTYNQVYKAQHRGRLPSRYVVVENKYCKYCDQTKPVSEFFHNKYQKDGLDSRCKSCSRQIAAAWKKAHPERDRENMRLWKIRNPDRRRESSLRASRRRYAVKKAAKNAFTRQEWQELCTKYNHRCLCCGKREPDIKLTSDHIQPLMKGGSHGIENIQPLCLDCNLRKGSKTIDYRHQEDICTTYLNSE